MMKPFLLFSICLLSASLLTFLPESRADEISPLTVTPSNSASAPWSVLGSWACTHPDWTGTITITGDGRFSNEDSTGRWTLTASGDRMILVLAWDGWPTETVTMITPDEFCGHVRGQGREAAMTMHRVKPPEGNAAVETHAWHQGDAPVRLIRKEEGFCALTLITGSFQGAGEMVRVYVGDDGYWYLGGDSHQEGVAAECIVVRYGKGK